MKRAFRAAVHVFVVVTFGLGWVACKAWDALVAINARVQGGAR